MARRKRDFNPRSPYGERPGTEHTCQKLPSFQSTLPIRGATEVGAAASVGCLISIHAPHTGSDARRRRHSQRGAYFNPRSPYGERQTFIDRRVVEFQFQSTLPIRGATKRAIERFSEALISIHAPHTGSDLFLARAEDSYLQFQSTLPIRGATRVASGLGTWTANFNPRSPYGERRGAAVLDEVVVDFNPRSPYGERPSGLCPLCVPGLISIHAPHTGSD